ncbi:LOW QUALITY PROTEIN: hypothetical protein HZS_1601 [Henneguya salminicola]|nr:LOW QUALITY PROTEIN: hypothetical protein HZS_1601 [Henneguya salminicola]
MIGIRKGGDCNRNRLNFANKPFSFIIYFLIRLSSMYIPFPNGRILSLVRVMLHKRQIGIV